MREDNRSGKIPPPGIDGTHEDSCAICRKGTDTALVFRGEAEWLVAGLLNLGLSAETARISVSEYFGSPPGQVPDGIHTVVMRVCLACVERSKAPFPAPVLAVPGAAVPLVTQPDDWYGLG
jgi:hypothetical protein